MKIDKITIGNTTYNIGANYSDIANTPAKLSDFTNDEGFIDSSALPTKVSDLQNDTGFITANSLPTKVSDLTNDSGFIDKNVDDLTNYTPSSETTSQLELVLNSENYKLKGILKDSTGTTIYTSNEIDLPIESVVVSGTYDSLTKEVVLTLVSGSTIRFSVADLVSGLVSSTDLSTALANYYTKSEVDGLLANIDLSSKQDVMQFSTMPTASADNLGKTVQYIGTTTQDYINGYFYQVVSDGEDPATYSWENIKVNEDPLDTNIYIIQGASDVLEQAQKAVDLISKITDEGIVGVRLSNIKVKPLASNFATRTFEVTDIARGVNSYSLYLDRMETDSTDIVLWKPTTTLNISFNEEKKITSLTFPTARTTAYLVQNTAVLTKTNTTAYTPTANYHPATKKYVDDYVDDSVANLPQYSNAISFEEVTELPEDYYVEKQTETQHQGAFNMNTLRNSNIGLPTRTANGVGGFVTNADNQNNYGKYYLVNGSTGGSAYNGNMGFMTNYPEQLVFYTGTATAAIYAYYDENKPVYLLVGKKDTSSTAGNVTSVTQIMANTTLNSDMTWGTTYNSNYKFYANTTYYTQYQKSESDLPVIFMTSNGNIIVSKNTPVIWFDSDNNGYIITHYGSAKGIINNSLYIKDNDYYQYTYDTESKKIVWRLLLKSPTKTQYELSGLTEYDNTQTYEVNDYVYYNNLIYKCNTAISEAEDFDDTKWTQKTYMKYMADILSV